MTAGLSAPLFVDAHSPWHHEHGLWAADIINLDSVRGLLKDSALSNVDIVLARGCRVLEPLSNLHVLMAGVFLSLQLLRLRLSQSVLESPLLLGHSMACPILI